MSGTFSMNYTVMADTIQQLSQLDGTINGALRDLESVCESQLSEWTADAKDAYADHKAKWNAHAQAMAGALASASQALGNITEGTVNGDRSAMALWQ